MWLSVACLGIRYSAMIPLEKAPRGEIVARSLWNTSRDTGERRWKRFERLKAWI